MVSLEQEAGKHNNHCICDAESKNISTSGHSLHSTATVVITTPSHIMFWVVLVLAMLQILTVSILEQSDLIKRHSLIPVTDVIQSHLLHFIFANNMFQTKMKKK